MREQLKREIKQLLNGLSKDEAIEKIDLLIWDNDMKELSYDFELASVLKEIRLEIINA